MLATKVLWLTYFILFVKSDRLSSAEKTQDDDEEIVRKLLKNLLSNNPNLQEYSTIIAEIHEVSTEAFEKEFIDGTEEFSIISDEEQVRSAEECSECFTEETSSTDEATTTRTTLEDYEMTTSIIEIWLKEKTQANISLSLISQEILTINNFIDDELKKDGSIEPTSSVKQHEQHEGSELFILNHWYLVYAIPVILVTIFVVSYFWKVQRKFFKPDLV